MHYVAYPIVLISVECIVCKDETLYAKTYLVDLCFTTCSCLSFNEFILNKRLCICQQQLVPLIKSIACKVVISVTITYMS